MSEVSILRTMRHPRYAGWEPLGRYSPQNRPTPRLRIVLFSVLCIHLVQCSGGADTFQVRAPNAKSIPDHIFDVVGSVRLAEDTATINVYPNVTIDKANSQFVIADSREQRIRLYDREGAIIRQFGRTGNGPGEFKAPTWAMREASGHIAVADFSGMVIEFDSTGSLLRHSQLPIKPLYTQQALTDGRRLVSGIELPRSEERHLLHVVDADTIAYSFFSTPGDSLARIDALHFGYVAFAMRGDTVAAVSALTDTLYVFTTAGKEVARVPIPFRNFRRMPQQPAESSEEIQGLLDQSHLISDLYWLTDGSMLFQYERPRGSDTDWNIMRMTRDGDFIFDVANTPRLLAIDDDMLFYFVDPQSMTPEQWIVARLR